MQPALKNKSLVGIVPISGREDKLELPWSDCLQPLGPGVLAIERSIYECAAVGCSSIWVICEDDTAPLIKKRIGDYVLDPIIYDTWKFKRVPNLSKKYIPIFYTPILQKDKNRRDSLGWSVLHGALTAFIVSSKISKWVAPTSYFVSFPYGIYNPRAMKSSRKDLRTGKKVYASFMGKTVRDNLYLPFSFTPQDWLKLKRQLRENSTGGNKSLPLHERWSAKNFTLDKIFKHDTIVIDKEINIQEYYDLDSWNSLRDFYSSELKIRKMSKTMNKPFFIKRKEDR